VPKELSSIEAHQGRVASLIKVDDNTIISGSYDNTIKIFDISDKRDPKELSSIYAHPEYTEVNNNNKKLILTNHSREWINGNDKLLYKLAWFIDKNSTLVPYYDNLDSVEFNPKDRSVTLRCK
jgi:WD40 repeat protein